MIDEITKYVVNIMHSKSLVIDMILISIFYVIGDVVTTYFGIQAGHQEYNPFMANIMYGNIGIWSVIILKIVYIIVLYYVLKHLVKKNQVLAKNILSKTVIGIGIFLTVSNLVVVTYGYNLLQLIGLM